MTRFTGHFLLLAFVVTIGGCKSEASKKQAPPAEASPPAADATFETSHQYYGVYLQGQKAGWAEEEVKATPSGGTLLITRVRLRIQRMGELMNLSLTDEVEYGKDGHVTRFEMVEEQPGGGKAVRRGHMEGGKLHTEVASGGKSSKQVMAAPKETVTDTLPRFVAQRLLDGDGTITTWQFDRQMLRDIPIETTLISKKETRIQGVPVTVLEVKGVDKVRSISTHNRMTSTGRTLEMTLGPGLKLVLEDEAMAKNPLVAVPDLYRLSVVPLDKRLGVPGAIGRLVVDLEGLPAEMKLADARQTRDGIRVTIQRRDVADLPSVEVSDDDRKRWLEATPFIDHADATLAAAAKSVASPDARKTVAALTRLVHGKLSYTLATAPLTASQILAGGRGDCTEYSRLMVAMARSLGYPAREVSGMAYAGDTDPGFAFHAWVEVLIDGKWLAADPTWNQTPVDATHIALSRDDPSAIVGVLGGLKARAVDVSGDPR